MTKFNVLIDTNVFIRAKYNFRSGALLNLKKYCDDGTACMITNDIIIREVNHHIETEVGLLVSQAKKAIKKKELINAFTEPEFDRINEMLLDVPKQLATEFTAYMEKAKVLDNSDLSIVDLFNDYFNDVAPFEGRKEKKSEFPDAVIIMSINRFVSSKDGTTLHVVTDDNGWHDALKNTPGVFLHKDIKSLLSDISNEKQKELYEQIISFLDTHIDELNEETEKWLSNQEWDFIVDDLEMCIECDVVEQIDVDDLTLGVNSIEYIDNEEGYAVATLSGLAKLKISFSYVDHTQETYDKEDHAWYNTIYGNGSSDIEVPISLSVLINLQCKSNSLFEIDKPEFEEIDRGNVVIVNYELKENREDYYHPYFDRCPDCGEIIWINNDGGNGFCAKCAAKH